jgi:hypothetical protein
MSSRELERVEVMGRVASGGLKLMDAAVMLQLSYRQAKRLWRRYQQVGRKGLKHGNAGRSSNRVPRDTVAHRVNSARSVAVGNDTRIRHPDGNRILAFLDIAGIYS